MLLPFIVSFVCVLLGFLFVLFAFVRAPWFLAPIFDVNLLYFLPYRVQKLVIGTFLMVVPPIFMLGFADYFP